jgi:hypothetical protein
MQQNPVSEETVNQYFELLKSRGKVFSLIEKGHGLIQWVE